MHLPVVDASYACMMHLMCKCLYDASHVALHPRALTTKALSAAHMTQNSSLSGPRLPAAGSASRARTSLAAARLRCMGRGRGIGK